MSKRAIVTLGTLAALAAGGRASAGPVGTMDEIAFTPVRYDLSIVESNAPQPTHGGLVVAYFTVPRDLSITSLKVNGGSGDPLLNKKVEWCDVVDDSPRAGEIAIVRCRFRADGFDVGDPYKLEVFSGLERIYNRTVALPAPTLTPSYIAASADESEILIHVRNDASVDWRIAGLRLNGADVTADVSIEAADLRPGEIGLVRFPRPLGIPYGEWLIFTVLGERVGAAETAAVTRSLRLQPPFFPLGDWTEDNGGDELPWLDPVEMEKYLSSGIDTVLYTPTGRVSPDFVLNQLAERYDFYVYLHQGKPSASFAAQWGNHPRLVGNAVAGEVGRVAVLEVLDEVKYNREKFGPRFRPWAYHGCMYNYQSFGMMADFSGMDHYAVLAPKCNDGNAPLAGGDRFELMRNHGEQIKYAGEPGPVWNWAQGLYHNFNRCATADEIRAQWYPLLVRGSKGMFWFQATRGLMRKCPAEPLDEMRRLAEELRPLKPYLLEGEMAEPGFVVTTPDPFVDVAATVGPRGIVIGATNHDYRIPRSSLWVNGVEQTLPVDPITLLWGVFPPEDPFVLDLLGTRIEVRGEGAVVWTPKTDVRIDLTPPPYFTPAEFLHVTPEGLVPLAYEAAGPRHWRATLPYLETSEGVLVTAAPEPPACTDADGDLYAAEGGACGPLDCDDANPAVRPGAAERCNGADDDCDDAADEDFPTLGGACSAGVGECARDGTFVCAGDGSDAVCSAASGDPSPELCNALDDDCDGAPDEDFPALGSVCTAGTGECAREGTVVCAADGADAVCSATAGDPSPELCNGQDDDCDGAADEDFPALGSDCSAGWGLCERQGALVCAAGGAGAVCSAAPGEPSDERCNGLDDDCDAAADEPFVDVGEPCTAGVGACERAGSRVCAADGLGTACSASPGAPGIETCNGADDDCDGATDEGFSLGAVCSVGTGACAREGTLVCGPDGAAVCDAVAGTPAAEACNGQDDDCDGTADEAFPDLGEPCEVGVGECRAGGARICAPSGAGTICSASPENPMSERCNGLDDNCSGAADEGFDLGAACSVGVGACAAEGIRVCGSDGAVICDAAPGSPSAETCNGQDDDCDGTADEGFSLGAACSVGTGACAAEGVRVCAADGAASVCDAVAGTPAEEVCGDAADEDCDGFPDAEDPDCAPVCTDADGDGFFAEGGVCGAPDCSDADGEVFPGALELLYNRKDDDCIAASPDFLAPQPLLEAVVNGASSYDAGTAVRGLLYLAGPR